jgi:hypothetical protein
VIAKLWGGESAQEPLRRIIAYIDSIHGSGNWFRWVKAPASDELTKLTHTITRRTACYLERQGLLEREVENTYLTCDGVARRS